MKRISVLLAAVLAAFVFASSAVAQDAGRADLPEPLLLEQVRALDMDSLQRGRATVHFTPGYREEAEDLGLRVDRELELFADSLGTQLEQYHLILPDRGQWKQLAEWPYGVPINGVGGWQERNLGRHVSGRPPSGIVPADAEGAVFEHLMTLEECAPSNYRKRLKTVGLSWEEASRRYVEAITFHEVGHAVADAYPIRQPLWFGEFFPNVLTMAYLYDSKPNQAKVWDLMTAVTLECQMPSHDRTLEASLRLRRGADDYHWFQAFLIQRANQVVQTRGLDFFRNARKAFPTASPGQSDPLRDKVETLEENWDQLSDEEALRRLREINDEMLQRLERIAPGFQEWARRFQAGESGQS